MSTEHRTSIEIGTRWNGTRRVYVATCSCGWQCLTGSKTGAAATNAWHLDNLNGQAR